MREKHSKLFESKRHLLSPRENDVLDCLLSGWRHKETADELGIAEQTVKNHVHNIRRATGLPGKQFFRMWLRGQLAA